MKVVYTLRRHWVLLLLLLIALALRIWYLTINPLWPQFSNADDGDYFQRALRFAVTGQYVDDSWLIRPPFHVWVFAAWLKLALLLNQAPSFGVRLIQGFQTVLGVLMVPLCYALATRLFNRRAGLLFAGFWAVWFPFVELPATLFSEPIYLFLFTLHLWLLLRFDQTGRYRDLVLSGLVLGMAALTRSPALYALVFAVPWLLLRNWPRPERGLAEKLARSQLARIALRSSVVPFAVLAVCTLIIVLPWTARNWIVYQRFIPIDTLGPINLWLDLGSPDQRNAKIEELRQLPQADRQAYASARVREILSAEPLRPFRNVWPTFLHIWKAQFVEDFWVKRSFFTRPLREAAPLGLFGDLLWLVASLAGVIGLLHPATDRAFKALLGLWLLYSFATVLVFHVEPRYLLSIWLLLGLYAGWTLSYAPRLGASLRDLHWRGAIVYSTAIILAALFLTYRNYPEIIGRGVQRELYVWRGDQASARGDYQAAEREYRAALKVDPEFVESELSLALTLAAQGRRSEALAVLSSNDSRRSGLVAGVLSRAVGDESHARPLLNPAEERAGEDAQRWALDYVPVEPRESLVLGDDALDLGYVAGFAGSERSGDLTFRWLLGDGEIVLPLEQPLAAGNTVSMVLAAPIPLDGPLQISVGNAPAAVLRPDAQWRVYRLSVPPALAGQRQLRLRLHAPTYLPMRADPASADPRPLSVMVHSVAVER
ncbi:MAG TPA: glycosyltransferase family 39 protein [Herpetosiphonaceae bacterium]